MAWKTKPKKLRPIKTAPRDGMPILVFADSDGQMPFVGYWGNPYRFVRFDRNAWIGHELGLHDDCDVVGWLPLPVGGA